MSHGIEVIISHWGKFITYLGILNAQPWFTVKSHLFYWQFLGFVAEAEAQGLISMCVGGGFQDVFEWSCRFISWIQAEEQVRNLRYGCLAILLCEPHFLNLLCCQ